MVQFDLFWFGSVQFGSCSVSVRFLFGLDQFGLSWVSSWLGLVWCGSVWFGWLFWLIVRLCRWLAGGGLLVGWLIGLVGWLWLIGRWLIVDWGWRIELLVG